MASKRTARDEDISKRPSIRKRLLKVFADVEKGFVDQRERADDILDYWDIYNCKLGDRQFYSGNSKIFVPIVRNAVEARKTRFVNQMFPKSGRNIEVVTAEQDLPHSLVALLEHYIEKAKLRTQVMPALMVAGDVEGQYTVYVDWSKVERRIVSRETKPVEIDGLEHPELGEVEDIVEETVTDDGPAIEVLPDADFLVLPATVDSLDEALEKGGSVTVVRRWTEDKIQQLIDDGEIVEDVGKALKKAMTKRDAMPDTRKRLAEAAGIKGGESNKTALVYETWAKLKVDGKRRLCRAYYGGDDQILGVKLNPFWCDRVPVLSAAVKKMPGVFKGQSLIEPGVLDMQIAANDAINEGMDAAAYALSPIIMTDPEKNPRVGSMILDMAAVWETDPNSTKFAEFPKLWQDAFSIVASAKTEIFQALGVNPSMIPQQTGQKAGKRNQAEVALEQTVDILTTADAVVNVEGEILTPAIQRFAAYDHQFRDDEMLVRSFGELGLKASMEPVKPIQLGKRMFFRWFGVEAARNAAQVQQMIAGLNVIRGIPKELYPGYELNVAPLLVHLAENTFGPRLAPLIFKDIKSQLAMDPQLENEMMAQGMEVLPHLLDNDGEHLKVHMQAPPGPQRDGHIQRHQLAMQAKMMAGAMQQGQQGAPGGAGPGIAGTPRPGGQVAGPRQNKGPAGMIHPDAMPRAGAVGMPRKM